MIKYFVKKDQQITESLEYSQESLIFVTDPSSEETVKLSTMLDFPPDFITDVLDVDERARIDFEENVTQIILKIPYKDVEDKKITFKTVPLGILIGKKFILIVSKYRVEFIEKMVNRRDFNIHKKSRIVFQIMYRNALLFLAYLKEINKISDKTEEKLHESTLNKELEVLMYLEKSLVYFTTSLRSNEIVMERILRGNILEIFEDDRELLEDTIVENKQALEMANIYTDILSGMMDAFASVISNNLNVVMKILTVVTIILQIPTILASFYGMNIALPFQRDSFVFLYIISWSIVGGILVIYWFKKKSWI